MFDLSPQQLRKLIKERAFTTEELVAFTGVDPFTFRNWLKRDLANVGEKLRVGRWVFSPADMIRISTMVDLVEEIGLPPVAANRLADAVLKFLDAYLDTSEKRRADPDWDGYSTLPAPMEDFVVIATVKGTEVNWGGYYWDEDLNLKFGFGPYRNSNSTRALLSLSHVSVGAGLIIEDIMEKVREALEQMQDDTEIPAVRRHSPVPDDPA